MAIADAYGMRRRAPYLTEEELIAQEQDKLGALAEPALSLGTSVLAAPVAGIAGPIMGAYRALRDDTPYLQEAVKGIEEVTGALTYQPRTRAGQATAGAIGAVAEPVGRFVADTALLGAEDLYGKDSALARGAAAGTLGILGLVDPVPGPANPFRSFEPSVIRNIDATPPADIPTQGLLLPDPETGAMEAPAYREEPRGRAFYSKLRDVIPQLPEKATGKEYESLLRNKLGVKQDEIKYTRLDQLLSRPGRMTRAEISEYMNEGPGMEFNVELNRYADPETGLQAFDPARMDVLEREHAAARAERDAHNANSITRMNEIRQQFGIEPSPTAGRRDTQNHLIREMDKADAAGDTQRMSEIGAAIREIEQMNQNASAVMLRETAARDAVEAARSGAKPKYGMMQLQEGESGMLDPDGDPVMAGDTYMESVLRVPENYTETGASRRYHNFNANPLVLVRSTRRPYLDPDTGEQIGTLRLGEQIQSDLHQQARMHGGYYATQPQQPTPAMLDEFRNAEVAMNEAASLSASANSRLADFMNETLIPAVNAAGVEQRYGPGTSWWDMAVENSPQFPQIEPLWQQYKQLDAAAQAANQQRAETSNAFVRAETEIQRLADPKSFAGNKPPDLPFQKSEQWGELGFKQLLADAIEAGDQAVAIPSGRYAATGQDAVAYVEDVKFDGHQFVDDYDTPIEKEALLKSVDPGTRARLQQLIDNYKSDDDIINEIAEDYKNNGSNYVMEAWEIQDDNGKYHFFRDEAAARDYAMENELDPDSVASGWAIIDDDGMFGSADHDGDLQSVPGYMEYGGLKSSERSANTEMESQLHDRATEDFNEDPTIAEQWRDSVNIGDTVYTTSDAAGVASFYDNIMPKAVKNALKKIDPDAQTKYTEFRGSDYDDHFLTVPITDKMREQYRKKGFELFLRPEAGAAALGGGAYLMERERQSRKERERREKARLES